MSARGGGKLLESGMEDPSNHDFRTDRLISIALDGTCTCSVSWSENYQGLVSSVIFGIKQDCSQLQEFTTQLFASQGTEIARHSR